ncbi:MAG: glycoside hydrolase family 13 protein [Christensenellaceae bacterium]|nr:glycoside hydrolase family 13 protein [Christensenellaceae bacterium]
MLLHDSHKLFFREPAGPLPEGSEVTIRLICDEATSVVLRTWMDEELCYTMMLTEENVWELGLRLPRHSGLFWYSFIVYRRDGRTIRYGNAYDKLGGEGAIYEQGDPESFQITVYQESYRTPSYMHGANIYQIFPDRFRRAATASVDKRTNRLMHKSWNEDVMLYTNPRSGSYEPIDFFGGTLTGIQEKLPYLKSLGIDILYLNPIFQANSNHRYDTGDYTKIDPLLGTEEEFKALCAEAEKLGMRVMLDGVFSHTGDDSVYFNRYGNYNSVGAYQGANSPYYTWYTFRQFPDDYRCWWNFTTLPECRKDNPDYQHFIFKAKDGVVPRWIHAGACGWRLDVADELSMDFLRKLRVAAKKAKPDAVVLGEVWEDASNKVAYGETRCYCTGDTLDSVMNYPLREAILSFITGQTTAHALARLVRHQEEVYPAQFRYALMNLIGSHDRSRVLNVLCGRDGANLTRAEQSTIRLTPDEYSLAVNRLRKCVDILCALPGCPTIYYGDEAGLTGCADPFCRRPFPWGHEDKELQSYIAAKLSHRRDSEVLKYGHCAIEAKDDDTIVITRTLGAVDALGNPALSRGKEVVTVKR